MTTRASNANMFAYLLLILDFFEKTHSTEDIESHGPIIIKQELEPGHRNHHHGHSSENVSRTSVFSDHLPCGLTRFHFSLCFGMVGFVVFWLGLLLRIYLPQ